MVWQQAIQIQITNSSMPFLCWLMLIALCLCYCSYQWACKWPAFIIFYSQSFAHCLRCVCMAPLLLCLRVFIHNADVSAAALLLPALSFCIEFSFNNGRQHTISLVSSIIDEWSEKWRPESWPAVTRNQSRDLYYPCSERGRESKRGSVTENDCPSPNILFTYLHNVIMAYIGLLHSTHVA